jgi:hypothetical protein
MTRILLAAQIAVIPHEEREDLFCKRNVDWIGFFEIIDLVEN